MQSVIEAPQSITIASLTTLQIDGEPYLCDGLTSNALQAPYGY